MLKIYTGVPGSGKSLHAIRLICAWLKAGKNVIANFPIRIDYVEKNHGHFFYQPNEKISVDYLLQFAQTMHREREEHQTLLVFDEASIKFNSRTFMDEDRLNFLSFFAQHRHYGYEVVMISQTVNQIDKQIRELSEIEVYHRKANNIWVYRWLPFALFISVERNTTAKIHNGHEYFLYSKYFGGLYDTFYEFNQKIVPEYSKTTQVQILKSELIPFGAEPKRMLNVPGTTIKKPKKK